MKTTHLREFKNIQYGPHAKNKFDLSLPQDPDQNAPIIVFIHGGAWITGDKHEMNYYRRALAEKGFASASMNYRLLNGKTVKMEEMIADIRATIAYISDHALEWKISGELFCLVGHSAGAHLSLMYAYAFNHANRVKAVVSIASPVDLQEPAFRKYVMRFLWKSLSINKLVNMLTGSDASKEIAFSPAHCVTCVPSLLFFAQQDEIIPVSHAPIISDILQNMGCPYACHIVDGGHFFLNTRRHQPVVASKIEAWARQYCRPEQKQ
jgi:acetyl esterase/lipase